MIGEVDAAVVKVSVWFIAAAYGTQNPSGSWKRGLSTDPAMLDNTLAEEMTDLVKVFVHRTVGTIWVTDAAEIEISKHERCKVTISKVVSNESHNVYALLDLTRPT